MATDKPSAAVMEMMRSRKRVVSDTTLKQIREKMEEVRDIDAELADLAQQMEILQKRRQQICGGGKERGELVDLFETEGIPAMTLDPRGNLPGAEFQLLPWFSASLPKDDEKRDGAMSWLRANRLGDLIKNTFTIQFGRGEDKKAKELRSFLNKSRIPYEVREAVHSQTLTAEVRRRFKSGKPMSPSDLETIGAAVGKHVVIKHQKQTGE